DNFSTIARFVREIRTAGPSITVIRTSTGAAGSVAVAIDRANWPEIVGSIQGDDTIFIATEDGAAQASLRERLRAAFRISPRADSTMTASSSAGAKPIVLAYSGGLDTSFLVPWVAENTGRPVITVTVDTGGIDADAARVLGERSKALGAIGHHQIDARADYFEQVLRF